MAVIGTPQSTLTRDQIGTRRDMSVTIRSQDEGRGFTGIGVPYGQTIDLWGMRERFEPGSVELDSEGIPSLILWQHDAAAPIGRITAGRDTEDGFEIEAALSQTARGIEAATLLDDGVITRLSIGFIPVEWRIEHDEDENTDTIVHTRVRAMEFSLVSFPAYSSAAVSAVRSEDNDRKEPAMNTTITRDQLEAALTPLSDDLADLHRSVATLSEDRAAGPAHPYFRDIGDYLKKVAAGDERALDFHARATTDETGLATETNLGSFIKWVQDRRDLINLFDSGALPAKGMSVEYAQLADDTTQAAEQVNELDDLAGPGHVELTTESERVRTFGGWTEFSRQVIDRLDASYLTTVMTALGLKYAQATNGALRARIVETINAQQTAGNGVELPASATVFDYRDAIIDASEMYSDRGFRLEGLLVSKDDFKAMQRLTYSEVPALTVRAGDEFSGTLNLPQANGNLASVPVTTIFGGYTGPAAFFDSSALKTLESAGAPLRLQDDNIINLSKAFSLYGYLSVIVPFPTAIVPLTTAAGA